MPPRTVILDILEKVSRNQSRFIRARLRGKKKRLYDFFSTSKNPENFEKAQKIVGVGGNAFAVLKSQLETKVILLLGQHAKSGTYSERILSAQLQGLGYQLAGQPKEASLAYLKALKLAEDAEDFDAALNLDATLRVYYPSAQGLPPPTKRIELSAKRMEVMQAREMLQTAEAVKPLRGEPRLARANEVLAGLLNRSEPQSAKAKLFELRAKVICYFILRDFPACLPLLHEGDRTIHLMPQLMHDPEVLETILAVKIVQAVISNTLGLKDGGYKVLEELKRILVAQAIPVPQKLDYHLLLFHIEAIASEPDPAKLAEVIGNVEKSLRATPVLDRKAQLELLFITAQLFFRQRQYGEAYYWLNNIRKLRRVRGAEHWHAVGAIMEMACLIEQDAEGDLDMAIRRAANRFRSANLAKPFGEIVLAAFRAINSHPKMKDVHLNALGEALGNIRSDEQYRLIFEAFDLVAWIRNR